MGARGRVDCQRSCELWAALPGLGECGKTVSQSVSSRTTRYDGVRWGYINASEGWHLVPEQCAAAESS